MLHLHHLDEELKARGAEFRAYDLTRREHAADYGERLRALATHTAAQVAALVRAERAPGALPSTELDARGVIAIGFDKQWISHEDARRWAIEILRERTTFAADGSQLMPGRDLSVPVAAVQIAWFENPHKSAGEYTKNARLHLIAPDELLANDAVSENAYVAFRRFEKEVEAIKEFMSRHAGWESRNDRMPLAFLDGTLQLQLTARQNSNSNDAISSDATNSRPARDDATDYIGTLKDLVLHSERTRVPVVGYVDQSYARDIVVMLNTIRGDARHKPSLLFDAQLLGADTENTTPLLSGWGARTILFYCLRRKLIEDFTDSEGRPTVGFAYMRVVMNSSPARLDIPAWVYDAGLLDEVADTVRAECVVGNGYPYPIETADAAAMLTPADRERFVRHLGEFSRREQLDFRISRKRTSKNHRR